MILITLAFCEKEGIVRVMGLEVLVVSTVDGFDVMNDDDLGGFLTAFSNGCCSELDPTFSLCTCSNGSSSKW